MGLSLAGRCFVGFIYATEFMESCNVPFVASIVLGFDGLTLFFAAIFFRYISIDWKMY
jgi:hypothetical protein